METVRIILVDDHTMLRDGTRLILDSHKKFKVVGEASNGQEALELAQKIPADLIIFDIEMPGVNGVALAKAVSERFPHLKMLVLTAYNDMVYLRTLLKFGINGFVAKSLSGRELVEVVESVMVGRVVLPSNMPEDTNVYNERLIENRLSRLSGREVEVLQRILKGERNSQIADELSISPKTLETHIRNIYGKLEIESRSELLMNVQKWQILISQFGKLEGHQQ